MKLINGDSFLALDQLEDNSVDALVTDPPAGIGFMGKTWDEDKGGKLKWIDWLVGIMMKCHQKMKPGAHGLVWALPRTSHWTATALEKSGFEIRDCVYHIFGSGFPKSLDISKAIDKAAGVERERVAGGQGGENSVLGERKVGEAISDEAITTEAHKWNGWGTALKPAVECWWLVRKPCSEKTVAQNVLKWGTGGINIDGCRVEATTEDVGVQKTRTGGKMGADIDNDVYGEGRKRNPAGNTKGRFPSHLILDEEAGEMLDEQSGVGESKVGMRGIQQRHDVASPETTRPKEGTNSMRGHEDTGGASRFFYCPKPSRSERNEGLEGRAEKPLRWSDGDKNPGSFQADRTKRSAQNHHPTVKSVDLMRYLCRLVTPPKGIVLDPFMGSGSTGIAAHQERLDFIGIEKEQEYYELAEARIKEATKQGRLFK